MEFKIKRAWDEKLTKYKDILEQYEAKYYEDEYKYHFAFIEIDTLENLILLSEKLKNELIVSGNQITIYDNYVE